jgi:hypothetical protein
VQQQRMSLKPTGSCSSSSQPSSED